MDQAMDFIMRSLIVGLGATIILDLWSLTLRLFGVATTNWGLVGRWIGHMPRGRFVHDDIGATPPIAGEHAIGWLAHYAIGVLYAAALLAIAGLEWARAPTLMPALIFGWATIVAPFFIMQPGMGSGVAASKAPKPNIARFRALLSHTVFGLGLYAAALLTAMF
ncbi:MAG TPA: DUF2938 domain-containing protein [Vitreimonas sp.]|nr:DUF2938 domain-containing protein [Vitreimonas sp.]